jgi:hypothetical protein
MLSLDYELSVPGFPSSEIGGQTLVRAYPANIKIFITNDGQRSFYNLNVQSVLESYVGLDKPLLFKWSDAQILKKITPQTMVPLTFSLWTSYPGLIAVAIHITDSTNNAIMVKRQNETSYKQEPVRWWFYVVDNISIEILKALKALKVQQPKEKKK